MTSGKEIVGRVTAADAEEHADLRELRDRADQAGRDAARTLGELTERLAAAGNPRAVARQAAGRLRERSESALTSARSKVRAGLAGEPGAARIALAAVPVLVLLAGAAVAYRRMRS